MSDICACAKQDEKDKVERVAEDWGLVSRVKRESSIALTGNDLIPAERQ